MLIPDCGTFFPSFLLLILSTMFLPIPPKLINLIRNKELFRVGSNFRVQIHSKTFAFVTFLSCSVRGSFLEEVKNESTTLAQALGSETIADPFGYGLLATAMNDFPTLSLSTAV